MRALFSSLAPADRTLAPAARTTYATLLVIQADDFDWQNIFSGVILEDGRRVRVWQVGWDMLDVHADTYSTTGVCVEVRQLAPSASPPLGVEYTPGRCATVHPDLVLVRNEVHTPTHSARGALNGLLFAGVPAVNSLESILLSCERPAMMGALHKIARRLGTDFRVVPQHFASSYRSFMYGYTFPAVVKVGSAHAGCGKMKIIDHHQMSDFRSILHMTPREHCFAEPFIDGAEDLRIQKIGSQYRAFRRRDVSGEWKTNTGTAMMEQVPIEARWQRWADEAAQILGGLDILTVDAIVERGTGTEWILEVNGTSSGLFPDCAKEDNEHIRDLVVERMNQL